MGNLKCCAPPMACRKRYFSWLLVFAVGAAASTWDVLRPQASRQMNGEATEKGQPPFLELFKPETVCPWRSCIEGSALLLSPHASSLLEGRAPLGGGVWGDKIQKTPFQKKSLKFAEVAGHPQCSPSLRSTPSETREEVLRQESGWPHARRFCSRSSSWEIAGERVISNKNALCGALCLQPPCAQAARWWGAFRSESSMVHQRRLDAQSPGQRQATCASPGAVL